MDAITATFHAERGRILAHLIRMVRDFDLAEDSLAEALESALAIWPQEGTPTRPGAWLTTVARRKALDRLRRDQALQRKLPHLAQDPEDVDADDRLSLMFTCCHPALAMETRVALTLRTLGGLTTAEIARAFLVPESTMAQRMVRAQRKIREAGIPYEVPGPDHLNERLDGVLAVLYLIFNEGYYASAGDVLERIALGEQALNLAEMLTDLMPREAEPLGLLALMLFQRSRSRARLDAHGEAVTLEEQDRSLWDAATRQRGVVAMDRAMRLSRPGPYQIQGAIACFHCRASSAEATDWTTICRLYDALAAIAPSPVVELNRAAALGLSGSPEAGLGRIDDLVAAGHLLDYPLLHSTRADLLRRVGRIEEAADAYRQALAFEHNAAVRNYLERRLLELTPRQ